MTTSLVGSKKSDYRDLGPRVVSQESQAAISTTCPRFKFSNKIFEYEDIVPLILSYLTDLKEMHVMAKICKIFRETLKGALTAEFVLKTKISITAKELAPYSIVYRISFSRIVLFSENLKSLDLSHSKIDDAQLTTIMEQTSPTLQQLYLRNCRVLTKSPDVLRFSKLEVLDLSDCERIQNAPNILKCDKLRKFYMSNCIALIEMPDFTNSINLEELYLTNCPSLLGPTDLSNCKKLTTYRRFTSRHWKEI